MKVIAGVALVLLTGAPLSASADPEDRILVDCNWMGGYLYGTAVLRDGGATETALVERAESLATAENWPNPLRLHLTNRVHMLFGDLYGSAPQDLSADYIYNCSTARGDIPENVQGGTDAHAPVAKIGRQY